MTEQVLACGTAAAGKAEFERASGQSRDDGAQLEKVLGLTGFLLSSKSDGITGKLISAVWDPWNKLDEFKQDLDSDIYTLRRIVPKDRGKAWGGK
jgi:3-oxoacyl-[acyl-carrier protein] reductase